jgi:hypothetical protein
MIITRPRVLRGHTVIHIDSFRVNRQPVRGLGDPHILLLKNVENVNLLDLLISDHLILRVNKCQHAFQFQPNVTQVFNHILTGYLNILIFL